MRGGRRISVRGGSGLGDALYVQAVARHLVGQGRLVEACSNYRDVFWPLRDRCAVSAFRRNATIIAHYALRRHVLGTDQFQDCCIQAGFAADAVELRLDWEPRNPVLIGAILAAARGRPVVAALLPRRPMARTDGVFDVLLPDCRVLQSAIDRARERDVFVVQVGAGEPKFELRGIDLDLANRTSVSDVIDAVHAADACVGYVSFMVPLAESLNKPMLAVWSRRGLELGNPLVARLTPQKVVHKKGLVRTIVDDYSEAELEMAVRCVS